MNQLTRRMMFQWAGVGAASLLFGGTARAEKPEKPEKKGEDFPFQLPKLPYESDALEAAIDKATMEIHHGRHHKAYVDNLNAALKDQDDLQKMSLIELVSNLGKVPEKIRPAVRNNAGGHLNHSWFWQIMSKDGGGEPGGPLGKAIDAKFGSFDKFQAAFADAGMKRFGSGWAWLVVKKGGLEIVSSPNQDNPLMEANGGSPILAIDVWEHAYYLRYQNKRADYIKNWWKVVNWKLVAKLHEAASA